MTRAIALTGGTGFIGAALIELLLSNGFTVRALVRSPEKLTPQNTPQFSDALNEGRLVPIKGDLSDQEALNGLSDGTEAVINGAGLVLAQNDQDYTTVNVEGAAAIAKAAAAAGANIVHLSSMSARAPHLSPYAASKHASEEAVAKAANTKVSAVSLRLPAIYGPRDMVTLPFFKLIKSGLAPQPASKEEMRVSILYVEDAAKAVISAIKSPPPPGVYEVGDDRAEGYSWGEIGQTLSDAMGRKAHIIKLPRPLLAAYYGASLALSRSFKRPPTVRTGQINEFFHPNWVAQNNLFCDATPWRPQFTLAQGFAKTTQWYREHGYI